MTERRGAFIYRDSMSRHVLREDHVFKPVRLRYTYELLEECGAFQVENGRLVDPRQATDEEVQTFHTPDYVAAVKAFGEGRMLVDPVATTSASTGTTRPIRECSMRGHWWSGAP